MGAEARLESKCRNYAKLKGMLLLKWKSPGRNGVHDRLLIVSSTDVHKAKIIPVEFKAPGGRLSPHQMNFHRTMNTFQVLHYTVDCFEQFQDICRLYR